MLNPRRGRHARRHAAVNTPGEGVGGLRIKTRTLARHAVLISLLGEHGEWAALEQWTVATYNICRHCLAAIQVLLLWRAGALEVASPGFRCTASGIPSAHSIDGSAIDVSAMI